MTEKEIGKLLELLNEYLNDKIGYIQYHNEYGFKRTKTKSEVEGERFLQNEYVLGKKFGFVKRLVEQDKIDLNKVEEKSEYTFLKKRGGEHFCEDVIMLLSISEQPIEFLCSILK